jgi:uncharacterized membrane protein YvlD (DUF360 family)
LNRQIIRVALITLALYFLFPQIPGIHVHGNFLHVFIAGIVFTILGWVVETIAIAITALLTIGTLGLALLVLIPVWLLGFWLIPAYVLKLTADLMPTYLSIAGWTPAIIGGLIMLVIGVATSGSPSRYQRTAAA